MNAHLDTTLDEVDRLRGSQESPRDGVRLGHLEPKLLPGARVAHALLPLLVDIAIVGNALQLLQDGVALAQTRRVGVVLERSDDARESTDAGVRAARNGGMSSSREHLELERDGALLSSAESRERAAVCVLNAGESLVQDECDSVLAVARLNLLS